MDTQVIANFRHWTCQIYRYHQTEVVLFKSNVRSIKIAKFDLRRSKNFKFSQNILKILPQAVLY